MLIRLTPPEGQAVDLDTVKDTLRILEADDDATLTRLIRSETSRYEAFSGRIMAPASFELRLADFFDPAILPLWPVRAVSAVSYLDETHAEQIVDPTQWYVARSSFGWEVRFDSGFSAPTLSGRAGPVRVRFSAGYDLPGQGTSPEDGDLVPDERDVTNILMLIQRIHDGEPQFTFAEMRGVMGSRRVFR